MFSNIPKSRAHGVFIIDAGVSAYERWFLLNYCYIFLNLYSAFV